MANTHRHANRHANAAMIRRVIVVLIMTVLASACVPAPTPVPTPQVALGGRRLHLPLVQHAPFRWQRMGYGRPWQSIGKDPELHRRGMWSYSWGLGACLYDVPMVFSDQQMPTPEALARCNATSEVLLVFNEPEYASQANMTPEVAAQALRYLESVWPGELWCCGNLVSHAGWFDRMMQAYVDAYREPPRLTGVHAHVYVNDGFAVEAPDDGRWIGRSKAHLGTYLETMRKWGVPARVVVSECCLLGKYGEDTYLAVQDEYMTWLRSVPEVESVAWFSARYAGYPDANLLKAGGGLTEVGEAWLGWRWK